MNYESKISAKGSKLVAPGINNHIWDINSLVKTVLWFSMDISLIIIEGYVILKI